MSWETIIENSLGELERFLKNSDWFGRENEIINLFAHKFLSRYLGQPPLISLTQIGIEVAVKQVQDRNHGKRLVRKDLVIWPEVDQTVWGDNDSYNAPAAILEWKINNESNCKYDIDWLTKFTSENRECVGYSVCIYMKHEYNFVIVKIQKGKVVL